MNRLVDFMRARAAETYPEPLSSGHSHITEQMMPIVMAHVRPGEVLDVGCGQGPALERFKESGRWARGIALNREDVDVCKARGFEVMLCDQNEMPDVYTGLFALVWARHVLEHSPIPFFTLHEFNRVLQPGGVLYAEVPGAGTSCQHETNANHYSVMGDAMWQSLILRSGFEIITAQEIHITTGVGPDFYSSYICRKL